MRGRRRCIFHSITSSARRFVAAFVRRLNELGYVDGHNLRLVYRSAEGRPELLSGLASDLIRMKPDVLVTGFGTVAAKAAKAAADGIPGVFMAVGDPVGAGVVESLARPGGNVTGLSELNSAFGAIADIAGLVAGSTRSRITRSGHALDFDTYEKAPDDAGAFGLLKFSREISTSPRSERRPN